MEKLKLFKDKIKDALRKIKNNIIEFYNKNKSTISIWSRIILIIPMILALIWSLFMINTMQDQINNLSSQYSSIMSSMESLNSDESDTNEDTTSSITSSTSSTSTESASSSTNSTSSTSTSSVTSSSKVSTPSTSTSSVTSSSTVTNPSTNTSTNLDLLACVIYQEAGGNRSCDNCRRRVADVVLNRVADPRFPNTIHGVLTSRNQYGRFYYTGVKWPSRANNVNEQGAVARAYRIAEEVLNGQHSDLYGNGYVWQAGFKQGSSQIKCCGTYFGK